MSEIIYRMTECSSCAKAVTEIEIFPKGLCVECYAASPEGQRMWTAEELVAAWGGKAIKKGK